MERSRSDRLTRLAWPLLVVGTLLIVMPMIDLGTTLMPFQARAIRWRFGAAGLISGALVSPLLGLTAIFGAGLIRESRGIERTVGVIASLAALCIGGLLLMFALDAVQLRGLVRPEAQTAFDGATIKAFLQQIAALGASITIAVAALRAARAESAAQERPVARRSREQEPLLVGARRGTREVPVSETVVDVNSQSTARGESFRAAPLADRSPETGGHLGPN